MLIDILCLEGNNLKKGQSRIYGIYRKEKNEQYLRLYSS